MYAGSKSKVRLVLVAALLMVLAVAVATVASAEESSARRNAQETLSQVQGRMFPNEMPPRDEVIVAELADIPVNAPDYEERVAEWYQAFFRKKEKSGPNPIAHAARMADLKAAEAQGKSVQEINGGVVGTAQMLMIPVEFNPTANDSVNVCDPDTGAPAGTTTLPNGPINNSIPNPANDGDNYTIWTNNFDIQWYTNLMFGNGVGVVRTDLNNGAGVDLTGISARNWYLEQSEGLYDLQGQIYPTWIQLDHSVGWYGWDGDEVVNNVVPCDGTPSGYGFEFVIEAAAKLNAADPTFDWAQYDVDGDGVVDHLMIIHAGVDNSAGGGAYGDYQLWAHSWDVYCDQDNDGTVELGCQVDGMDTPADTTDDIYIANYTHIPEDADIGVVVHEYGHDIGLPDYYDTSGATSNSTAHWIVMSGGSWSGMLGGSHPAPFNPWARYFFGWETPVQINYDDPGKQSFNIGQSEPTPDGTEDSVWINLPDQTVVVSNTAGTGAGLHTILGNYLTSPLQRDFDLTGATSPTLTFDTDFIIEEDWDYAYVRASTDGGTTWDILLNNEGIYATLDPNGSTAWLGVGGLTGSYTGALTYDLSAYAGNSAVTIQFVYLTDAAYQDPGMTVDNIAITDGATTIYSTDLEVTTDWTIDGWEVVPYTNTFPHYYMLEWRNEQGSIASEGHNYQYYSLAHAQDGWLVDMFPANVPGLLVWYRNGFYGNNNAVAGGRATAGPSYGGKGELLLVDSHFDPVTWSVGFWNPTATPNPTTHPRFSNRRGAMDGAFTLETTPPWMIHDLANSANAVMDFGSRPAVSTFNDNTGWAPGLFTPNDNDLYAIDVASSVVIPSCGGAYTTRLRRPGADGTSLGANATDMYGINLGWSVVGSGNPVDAGVACGVQVDLTAAAADGTFGTVSVWNNMLAPTAVTMADLDAGATGIQTSLALALGSLFALGMTMGAIRFRRRRA